MNPSIGQFCWNELATTNLTAAKDFYAKSFGWSFTDSDMGEMTYTMIKSDGKEFAGMWQIPTDKAHEIPPHWMCYILVKNLENSLKEVQKNGATIQVPATPVGNFGQFAVIIDPTGAHIALWESMHD